jgi:hypothetical protein
MTRLTLAGAALALTAAVTASAMASDRKACKNGNCVGRFHAAAFGGTHHVKRNSRLAGVRREPWQRGLALPRSFYRPRPAWDHSRLWALPP